MKCSYFCICFYVNYCNHLFEFPKPNLYYSYIYLLTCLIQLRIAYLGVRVPLRVHLLLNISDSNDET